MVTENKIKTVLIGLGRIATRLETDSLRRKPCTHVGVLFSAWGKNRFSLQKVIDPDILKIQDFIAQWPSAKGIPFSPSVLASKNDYLGFELGVIATPSHTHFEVAKKLIDAGINNLLIEKPVCLRSTEAKELLKLSKLNSVKIWVNHERRYHPQYKYVRDEIRNGNLGQVKTVKASVYTSAKNPGIAFSKAGGGPLLHDGTHAIDILHWLFGKLKLRYAKIETSSRSKIEDRATAWFHTLNGLEIFLDVSGGRSYFQFEIDILTDKCRILLSNDGFQFWKSEPSKLYQGFRSLLPVKMKDLPELKKSNAFLGIYDEIYRVLREKETNQEATLKDNIDILESIESIYKFRRKK